MRRLPRVAAGGAAVALAVGFAAAQAGGPPEHGRAAVTSTSPADGATLARPPSEVTLSVTGPVDQGRSHIVVDGSGAASAHTAGALRQTAPGRLSQPITVTAAGEVTVAYHVTFTDGAQLAGSLRFTAPSGDAAGRAAPAASASASAHEHDIDPVSAGLLVVDGIAALAVVVLLMRRPRRPAPVAR